eukprot:TRINITY_DN68156_c5_g1_i9.p1 TRINITY_DN68156_c5_g1~~TRINITY_DN68156_c5_g1_i9.p1  ORF type:complete len:337 (-),score=25.05 TRINITY_DN68156_c5_g1_i9:40-1050(-)
MDGTACPSYTAVEEAFSSVIQTLTDAQDCVQEKWDQFKKRRTELEKKMKDFNLAVNGHKKVKLNVGGTHFDTTEGTLLKETDTFFWAMLRSGQWHPDDEDGRYFIDRSPKAFAAVLDYLRDGKMWDLQKFNKDSKLREEFDFYQLTPPTQPLLTWDATSVHQGPDGRNVEQSNAGLNIPDKQTVVIVTSTPEPRWVFSNTFPAGCEDVAFVLKATRPHVGVLYFRPSPCGLTLGSGRWCLPSGDWDLCFPPLSSTSKGWFCFRICRSGGKCSVTVAWPSGDTKTLSLPTQPTRLELVLSGAYISGTTPLIKHNTGPRHRPRALQGLSGLTPSKPIS